MATIFTKIYTFSLEEPVFTVFPPTNYRPTLNIPMGNLFSHENIIFYLRYKSFQILKKPAVKKL